MVNHSPTSIRLSEEAAQYVAREARRIKRSKSAVLNSLVTEAVRMRQFPGVAFRGPDHDRRAWLLGCGWDVWELVAALDDFQDDEALIDAMDRVDKRDIEVAKSYRHAFSEEIDRMLAENRVAVEEIRQRYPFIQTIEVE